MISAITFVLTLIPDFSYIPTLDGVSNAEIVAGSRWKGPEYVEGRVTGFVFTSEVGTIFEPRNLNRYFDRVREHAGMPTHTFHGLRHNCASLLLSQGVPLWAVSKILGHSEIPVTANVYGHLAHELQREAAPEWILCSQMPRPKAS